MNNKFSGCVFVTKEYWFDKVYNSNKFIIDQINKINLIKYQKIILKIKKLNQKQIENPINSRTQLIELKEIQKKIFQNQLRGYYTIKRTLTLLNNNPNIFLSKPIPLKNYRNQYLKGKVGLLKSIFEMERKICQLVFMKDITLLRNEMIVERNESQPNISTPKLRKLFQNWMNSNQPLKNNRTLINMEYTNYLAQHMKNYGNEHKRIFKNVENDNYNLSLRFKKEHLKTEECRFAIKERTPNENSEFLHELEDIPFIPWEILLDKLGLNSLPFLNQHPIHKRAIIRLLNLYLMPITEPFDDIFRLKREYYLLCISFVLLDFNTENISYLPESKGTSGFTASTRLNNESIYKLENLRLKNYPKSSYMSSIYLFSFFIQKYLYNLNPLFVPNIENIYLHLTYPEEEKRKSITKMNLARKNRINYKYSLNLQQLLIKPIQINKKKIYFCEINFFYEFIIEVLKKICEILIFYQNECFFVHRDLHLPNIIVNFNIINNKFDLSKFEVKLIDFTFSSLIIFNSNNIPCEFMNSSFNHFMDIRLSNPYLNKDWNTYDLRYFIITFLFARLYDEDLNKLNKNIIIDNINYKNSNIKKINNVLKKIRNLILNILHINEDYRRLYVDFKNSYNKSCIDFNLIIYRELLFKQEIFEHIFGTNCKIEYFNPRYFLNELKKKRN